MKDVTKTLILMLRDPIAIKRLSAAVAIGELVADGEDIIDALRQAASQDPDTRVRRWIAEAIGAIGPETIVSDLGPLLADPSRDVRTAVRNVLANSSSVRESDMEKMLAGADERARKSAIAVLGAMGTPSAQTLLMSYIRGAKSKIVTSIIDALRPPMADGDAEASKHIVSELNKLLRVEENLSDPDFAMAAVQLLGYGGSFGATDVLMRIAAQSTDVYVRVHALETIQRIAKGRHPQVFEALLDLAENESIESDVRMAALNCLENLEIPITMDARVRGLTKASISAIRRWSIKALGGTDSAPAAETLMSVVLEGVADDREMALAASMKTVSGRVAAARLLGRVEDEERGEEIARTLRKLGDDLTQDVRSALEQSVMEASPEIGQLILNVLKRTGDGNAKQLEGNLLERAVLLKNKRKFSEAASMLTTICQGTEIDPNVKYNLGVCELKLSKRKIVRGLNHDRCLSTFGDLLKVRDYSLLEKLTKEKVIEEEDLYYLGFSLAERNEAEQSLGGDLLLYLTESSKDAAVRDRAENKLKTMGWLD